MYFSLDIVGYVIAGEKKICYSNKFYLYILYNDTDFRISLEKLSQLTVK